MHTTAPVRHCGLAARLAIALAPGSTSGCRVGEVEMGSPARLLEVHRSFLPGPPSALLAPTPCVDLAANDGLTASAHLDVLNDNCLLTARAQPLQRCRALVV